MPSTSRRRVLQAASAGVVTAVAGCTTIRGLTDSGDGGAEWTLPAKTPRNTGHTEADGPGESISTAWTWHVDLDGDAEDEEIEHSAVAVGDDRLYTGVAGRYGDGQAVTAVVALNPDGTRAWRQDLDVRASATTRPVVADGTVFQQLVELRALSAEDGSVQWTKDTGVAPFFPPTYRDGTLYVGGQGLAAVAADDGTVEWSVDRNVEHVPAVAEDTVYVSSGPKLVALSRSDGGVQWSGKPGTESSLISPDGHVPPSAPVVGADAVYVASTERALVNGDNGVLTAVDPTDGEERWRYRPGTDGMAQDPRGCYGVPAFDGERVYVVARRGDALELHAVDADGRRVWTGDLPEVASYVVATPSGVYAVTDAGVVVFDPTDGTRLGSTDAGESTLWGLAPHALASGELYATDRDRGVVAFDGG